MRSASTYTSTRGARQAAVSPALLLAGRRSPSSRARARSRAGALVLRERLSVSPVTTVSLSHARGEPSSRCRARCGRRTRRGRRARAACRARRAPSRSPRRSSFRSSRAARARVDRELAVVVARAHDRRARRDRGGCGGGRVDRPRRELDAVLLVEALHVAARPHVIIESRSCVASFADAAASRLSRRRPSTRARCGGRTSRTARAARLWSVTTTLPSRFRRSSLSENAWSIAMSPSCSVHEPHAGP